MAQIWDRLNQPFPEEGSIAQSLKNLIGVSVFVGLFLFLLKPFGLSARSDLATLSLGFGLVTFFVGLIHDLLVRRILKIRTDLPSWTLWKWILNMLILIVLITVGNFVFMNWWTGWIGLDLQSLLNVLVNTALVGIIPVVFIGLLVQNRENKKNALEADKISLPNAASPTTGSNVVIEGIDYLEHEIRFIEAQQNYVSIYFVKEGQLQNKVVRTTFRNLEELLDGSSVIRCHRSFFVNKKDVVEVKGNAQGLKLALRDLPEKSIPVSKSYTQVVKAALTRP